MQLDSSVVAVVTGGASGLGEATARALAAKGVKVALFDVNQARGEGVAKEIGGLFCNVDVTSEESVDAGFVKARAAHGQERLMINCAGTSKPGKTASRDRESGQTRHYSVEDFNRILQINLVGTFRCTAKSAQGMLDLQPLAEGERGVIVNTASIAAQDGQVGQISYTASKAAIVGMTLNLARDLMNDGIRALTIMPGLFDTPLLQSKPEVKAKLEAMAPFPKRLGQPGEYASLVLTVIDNVYLNGEAIRLDAALRMPPR